MAVKPLRSAVAATALLVWAASAFAQDATPTAKPDAKADAKGKAQPAATADAKPDDPWDPAKTAARAKERRERFTLQHRNPLFQNTPLLGKPILISPRALGYIRALPIVRLGRDGNAGTTLRLDGIFGLDNYEVAAPEIHFELQTDLWGYLNQVRCSVFDSEFRGTQSSRTAFQYDSTFFPQGTVIDTRFQYQEVDLRIFQHAGTTAGIEWWGIIGGRYARSQTTIRDPLGGRRESNRNDAAFPVGGLRVAWTPEPWFSLFVESDGWGWSGKGTRIGAFRVNTGIEFRLGKGWGLVIGWGWSYLEVVHHGGNRDALRYITYGPQLTILAGV